MTESFVYFIFKKLDSLIKLDLYAASYLISHFACPSIHPSKLLYFNTVQSYVVCLVKFIFNFCVESCVKTLITLCFLFLWNKTVIHSLVCCISTCSKISGLSFLFVCFIYFGVTLYFEFKINVAISTFSVCCVLFLK